MTSNQIGETQHVHIVSVQMTKLFFSALGDEKVQQKLLSVMFDLLADNKSPLVANSVGSVFKVVRAEAEQ